VRGDPTPCGRKNPWASGRLRLKASSSAAGSYADQAATLPELLERAAAARPAAPAACEAGGPRLTYGELWTEAERVAGGLQRLGVAPGDRVALLMANSIDLLVGLVGAWRSGAVAVMLNTKYTAVELAAQFDASTPRVLLAQPEWLDKVDPRRVQHVLSRLNDLGGAFAEPELDADDPALLMFTSGTTGRSKGALQSHLAVPIGSRAVRLVDPRALARTVKHEGGMPVAGASEKLWPAEPAAHLATVS
jgi:acyl-CoA synthetase (AMP-forming)/AMP-acid ligase II